MRASNLVTAVTALMLSTAGFMAIDHLFTHLSSWHERQLAEVVDPR